MKNGCRLASLETLKDFNVQNYVKCREKDNSCWFNTRDQSPTCPQGKNPYRETG